MKPYLKCFIAGIALLLASVSFGQDNGGGVIPPLVESDRPAPPPINLELSKIAENELEQSVMEYILIQLEHDLKSVTDEVELNRDEVLGLTNALGDFREGIRARIGTAIDAMCMVWSSGGTAEEAYTANAASKSAGADNLRNQAFSTMNEIDSMLRPSVRDQFIAYYDKIRDTLSQAGTYTLSEMHKGFGIPANPTLEYHCK